MKYFFEIFEPCFRLGPGDDETTIRVFKMLKGLPDKPEILDIGCGNGAQSLVLAGNFNCHITAIDNHEPFLVFFREKINDNNLHNKITVINKDMNNMDFSNESFDIIWSEGALYSMGFENGLKKIKKLLKTNGYIAISELCWFLDNRPKEISDFFNNMYPDIKNIEDNMSMIEKLDYKIINHFSMPKSSWQIEFYDPLQKSLNNVKDKYKNKDNKEAHDVINMIQLEIDMYKKYSDYYGYEFFILQK